MRNHINNNLLIIRLLDYYEWISGDIVNSTLDESKWNDHFEKTKNDIKHLNAITMYVRKVKSWKVFDKPNLVYQSRADERASEYLKEIE